MTTTALVLPDYLDTTAIIVGALTGGMFATRKGLDVVGVFCVAFSTGIGGGLIRDILLQNGYPAILTHPFYQLYAVIGALIALFFARLAVRLMPVYEALDTFMIGAWVLLGVTKAQAAGLEPIPVIFIGTIAACGGMLLRDVLVHDPPEMMRPGLFYTIAAFLSASAFVVSRELGAAYLISQLLAMTVAIMVRVISVHFGITSPTPYDLSEKMLRIFKSRKSPSGGAPSPVDGARTDDASSVV